MAARAYRLAHGAQRDELVGPYVEADTWLTLSRLVVSNIKTSDHQEPVALARLLSQVDETARGANAEPLRRFLALTGCYVGALVIDADAKCGDRRPFLG